MGDAAVSCKRRPSCGMITEKEVDRMSDKERVISLLDQVPAYKMGYVLTYVQGITADEAADDAFCERMLEDYRNDPDPDKDEEFAWEDCKKSWGLD